jgi:alanyl-tRNA synthetase
MEEQRRKAREALKSKDGSAWGGKAYANLDKAVKTKFVGYEKDMCDAKILYIIKNEDVVDNAQEGDEVSLILDTTPFYAESGGQVGDTGIIESRDGTVRVLDCKKTADGKFIHNGIVEKGIIEKDSVITAKINSGRRMAIARNHSATHLLQKALQEIVGEHVSQAGSLVEPDKLRFDFTHFSGVTTEELEKVEKRVNEKILEGMPIDVREMPIDDAKKLGAMALFGEKYGNIVRVVKMGDYSLEFCVGTHLRNTAQAGLIKIVSESGVAAGVRRIEALTGENAIGYFNNKERILNELAVTLKTTPQDSLRKVESLTAELKNAEKEIEQLRNKLVSSEIGDILSKAVEIKGIKAISAQLDQLDMDGLRNTGDMLKGKIGSGVVILASGMGGKVCFVVTATKDVLNKGIHCGNIVREIAKITGGGGGGRPDMAQAGGKDISKISEALEFSYKVLETQIGG